MESYVERYTREQAERKQKEQKTAERQKGRKQKEVRKDGTDTRSEGHEAQTEANR